MEQIHYKGTDDGVEIPLSNGNILIVDGHVTHCLRRYGDGYMLTTNEKHFKAHPPFIYPDKMVFDRIDIIELQRTNLNANQAMIHHQLISTTTTDSYKKIMCLLQEVNNDILSENIIINLDGTYYCVSPVFLFIIAF